MSNELARLFLVFFDDAIKLTMLHNSITHNCAPLVYVLTLLFYKNKLHIICRRRHHQNWKKGGLIRGG